MKNKTLALSFTILWIAIFAIILTFGLFFCLTTSKFATKSSCQSTCSQEELSAVYEALEECQTDLGESNTAKEDQPKETNDYGESKAFKCSTNTFGDFSSLKVNDYYSCAAIAELDTSTENSTTSGSVTFVPQNAEVMAYLRGSYECSDKSKVYDTKSSWYTSSVCFTPDDDFSLPRFKDDKSKQAFCFANYENKNAEDFFCSENKTGRAFVSVKKYLYTYKNKNSQNTALEWSAEFQKPMPGIEIGAKMSGMTIKSYINEDYDKELNFTGKTRITGDYVYYNEGEYDGGWACFRNLDADSEAKMPKLPENKNEKSEFCISNSELLQKELISVATSGRATIDIDNFNLVNCDCGAWNNAELIEVILVKTNKATSNTCPKIFNNFSAIKNGDCYADMIANDVKIGYMGKEEGSVLFKATPTDKKISGKYEYYNKDYAFTGGLVCFYPDNNDELPRAKNDSRDTWFCFSNQEEAQKKFGPIGSSGNATIYINDYYYFIAGTEGWNKAELKEIVNK